MKIAVVGANHRTAALSLRDHLVLSEPKIAQLYQMICHQFPHLEAVALSTCNRTELYVAGPIDRPPQSVELIGTLAQCCGVGGDELAEASIQHEDEQAVRHLFAVAAGIDSMVLGEPQILGQVKKAYHTAQQRQTVGPTLHTVFQRAIGIAKQARRETGIGDGRVSVGSVAVDFARQIFEHFTDKVVVAVGAGAMAKLMLRHLLALQPARLWITNRTARRATDAAQSMGIDTAAVRPFEQLDDLLVEADIVLTSTGAEQPIITASGFRPLLGRRRHRPLFVIDIAVPRDVEPAVGSLSNVYLYDLDDLQQVIASTYEQRGDQVERCRALLADAAQRCMHDIQHRDLGQLIRVLRQKLHAMGKAEGQRTLRKIASADPADVSDLIDEHSHRLINKILHLPLDALDGRRTDVPIGYYAQALQRLFKLDEPSPGLTSRPEDVTIATEVESKMP